MSLTHAPTTSGHVSLAAMTRIEAGRLARHPVFLLANLVAAGLLVLSVVSASPHPPSDLLSWPVVPAFFIGLTSLVLMARQTRSTEAAAEAVAAAPGTEGRRTAALCLAGLVPALSGLAYVVAEVVVTSVKTPTLQEWWFGTLPDLQVWAMLVANGPVACLGGALLGVLVGRWLRFPGAAAVAVVVVVVVDLLGQFGAESAHPVLRLWVPWAMFQSGTNTDGTATMYAGNAVFYLVYVLCLCAAAALAAVWHDRVARTAQLKAIFAGTVLVGLVALALSMTTGATDNRVSDPVPWKVQKS